MKSAQTPSSDQTLAQDGFEGPWYNSMGDSNSESHSDSKVIAVVIAIIVLRVIVALPQQPIVSVQ